MYAFMWLALDQTDSEECSSDQANEIETMKRVTQERQYSRLQRSGIILHVWKSLFCITYPPFVQSLNISHWDCFGGMLYKLCCLLFVFHRLKDSCRNVLLSLNTVQCPGREQPWLALSNKQVSTMPSGLLPGCRETSEELEGCFPFLPFPAQGQAVKCRGLQAPSKMTDR